MQKEALERLIPSYSPRPYPWDEALLHPLKLMIIGLPFSILALWTLWPEFYRLWDERGQRLIQALHCWTWPSMLFWSLPTEHTPRHSFPLFPGLSGLAALVVLAWLNGRMPWRWVHFRPQHLLLGAVALWLVLKVGYVHGRVERHSEQRQASAKGHMLAALVPGDAILYLIGIKDEGIMFYFGRPVLRVSGPEKLPTWAGPVYCLIPTEALEKCRSGKNVEIVQEMTDAQGDEMYLVRVTAP
jgi:hypothetical protein